MLIPDDPTQAGALATAVTSVNREAYAIIEFDWNRDGLYTHQYSDLSELASDVQIDRAHASSLPDGVNAVSGFTSAQADLTLGGSLISGVTAKSLFDPFDGGSPLASFDVIGTPLRVYWRERTPIGDIDTPGFTGFVSKFNFLRVAGTVAISGVDNYDMIGPEASLPRWAAATTSPRNDWGTTLGAGKYPLATKWAMFDILRQVGRSPIRNPRGSLSFQSMLGSTLPAFGAGVVFDRYQLQRQTGLAGASLLRPSGWNAPYYRQFTGGEDRPPYDKIAVYCTQNMHSAQYPVFFPVNATSNVEQDLGFAANFSRTFSSTDGTTALWSSTFYIEDFRLGEQDFVPASIWENQYTYPAQISIGSFLNGKIAISLKENSDASFNRAWSWVTTSAVPLSTDLSTPTEVHVKFRFLNNNLIPEVRFDGVVQTLTAGGGNVANVGIRYREFNDGDTAGLGLSSDPSASNNQLAKVAAGRPRNGRSNAIRTELYTNLSTQYPNVWAIEWYAPDPGSQITYAPRDTFPLLPNGKPLVRFKTRSTDRDIEGWLYYLPEVNRRSGWDALKDIVDGFRGTMFMDEWGTLNIGDSSWAQIPVIPDEHTTITLDSLEEININPTDDNRRNNVILNGQFRGSVVGWVYQQQSATEKYAPAGTSLEVILPINTDTVQMNKRLVAESNVPPSTDDVMDITTGHVAAAFESGTGTSLPANSWQAGMAVLPGEPRFFKELWNNTNTLGQGYYIGSYQNRNQALWNVSGLLMSEALAIQGTARDADSIAEVGTRTLSLDTTEWLQTSESGDVIAQALITNLVQPSPIVEDLAVPADARRQVFDVVEVIAGEEHESGARFFAQILSKTTRWSGDEYTDTLSLRLLGNPGTATWDFGTWDTSNWG